MSHNTQEIELSFFTATSRSLERLQERAQVAAFKDVINLALYYFEIYMLGTSGKDHPMVMFDPHKKKARILDDSITSDYIAIGPLYVVVEHDLLNKLAESLQINSVSEMLTRSLVLLEKIFDTEEAGWIVCVYDHDASAVDQVQRPVPVVITTPALTKTASTGQNDASFFPALKLRH